MQGRAVIYARISSDREGRELGVDRQVEDCRELAARLGLTVIETLVENDTGASTKSRSARPKYEQMLTIARSGAIDTILAYSNSRLTRRPRENEDLIELAEQRGIRITTVASGEYDLNRADGRAIARTLAAWDAAEAERTAERVKRASEDRERRGMYHGGTPPYGYEAKAGMLVPNAREVERIREAVDRLLHGDTASGVVKDWRLRGITTRKGKIWRVTGLRPILRNPAILGKNKFGDVKWEPIIDQPTFDRLDRLFSDPSRWTTISPGVKGGRYSLGGGLVRCGECGHTLTSYRRGSARGDRAGLRCATHTGGCGKLSIDYERLETYVFSFIDDLIAKSTRWDQQQTAQRSATSGDALVEINETRAGLTEKRRRVVDLHVDGLIGKDEARERTGALDREIELLDQRTSKLLGATMFDVEITAGLDMTDWTAERKRNFAKLFLERIVISTWPTDVPKGVPKRREETSEEHLRRFEEGQLEALKKRVQIVPKS